MTQADLGLQSTFDWGVRPALGREDFLVAPCNEAAVAWLDRWPDWPGPALVIHGPPGSGKRAISQRCGGVAAAPRQSTRRPSRRPRLAAGTWRPVWS